MTQFDFNKIDNQLNLITVTEAANILGITKNELKQMVENKGITKHCVNEYRYLLNKDDIQKLN